MSQFRYVKILPDVLRNDPGPAGPRPPFAFTEWVSSVLLADARFAGHRDNVRSGDRVLALFEVTPGELRGPGAVVELHEVDWAKLRDAMNDPQGGNSTLLPSLARIVMRAGWYDAIENAPTEKPDKVE